MSIFDKIQSTAQTPHYLRVLLHGNSGSGKTTSLATLPEKSTLILVTERGAMPLAGRDFKILPIVSMNELRQFMMELNRLSNEGNRLQIGGNPIHTIVLDSLTATSDLLTKDILRVVRPEMMKERSGGRTDRPANIYEDVLSMEDYQLHAVKLQRLIEMFVQFREPNYNFIVTCLSQYKENKKTGQWLQMPEVTGSKSAVNLTRHFDIVGYAHTDPDNPDNRLMKVSGGDDLIAKDASGYNLGPILPLDWTAIFQKCGVGKASKSKQESEPKPTISQPSQNSETTNPQPVNGSGKPASKSTSKPNTEKE